MFAKMNQGVIEESVLRAWLEGAVEWAALSVSVVVFLVMGLPAMPLSFAKQPLYVVLWSVWEQVLLIAHCQPLFGS